MVTMFDECFDEVDLVCRCRQHDDGCLLRIQIGQVDDLTDIGLRGDGTPHLGPAIEDPNRPTVACELPDDTATDDAGSDHRNGRCVLPHGPPSHD